jgi:hypothetical protein
MHLKNDMRKHLANIIETVAIEGVVEAGQSRSKKLNGKSDAAT